MEYKNKLKTRVWSRKKYYDKAHLGSLDTKHLGMRLLKLYCQSAKSMIDLGCGEGTRLGFVSQTRGNKAGLVGVDISNTAIKLAKKKFPGITFQQADLEHLSFVDESFDLVYSAFVLEHLSDPEQMLREAIRITKSGGKLLLIAPNFGAPNRQSPPFKGSRLKKLIFGFFGDFLSANTNKLSWNKVTPVVEDSGVHSDWDTTVEPYLRSLTHFLRRNGLMIEEVSSCWSEELIGANFIQRIFEWLGKLRVYPFWMWGPHLVVVAKK